MKEQLVVSYRGPQQSRGEISAYTAFESMLAFSQATTMILIFLETGKVRRRGFAEMKTDLRLVDTREGSFEFLLEYGPAIGSFVAGSVSSGFTWDMIKASYGRVMGEDSPEDFERIEGKLDSEHRGSYGALLQALEPPLRRVHTPIGRNANKIVTHPERVEDAVTFDHRSKAYLLENLVNDMIRTKRFLVTSFDGRQRSGRVFDLEAEQAYTFELRPDADYQTLKVIVDAAYAYALRSSGGFSSDVEAVCKFTSLDAADGRIKKLKIISAAKSYDALG